MEALGNTVRNEGYELVIVDTLPASPGEPLRSGGARHPARLVLPTPSPVLTIILDQV